MSHPEFMERFGQALKVAMKMKEKMLARTPPIRHAITECPMCNKLGDSGTLRARLHPNRRSKSGFHIHMKCDGPCNSMVIE